MQQDSAVENETCVVELQNTDTESNLSPNILLDTTLDKETMDIDKDKESLDNEKSKNKSVADMFSGIKFVIWILNVFLESVT